MASKGTKKTPSTARAGSALNKETASIAASIAAVDAKKRGVNIWPEWSDADINSEKWEVAHRGGGGKGKEPKSPVVQHYFDDPEGKVELPPSLKVDQWKRPQDFIVDKTPVVIDPENGISNFDLMTANETSHDSEMMRWISSQVLAVWAESEVKHPPGHPPAVDSWQEGEFSHSWRPWEHIYSTKVGKEPNKPAYNPYGKYAVKLYWMGCWRKVIVDDTLPFNENDRLLLPATTLPHELWPMLLTKALLKVAALDYSGGSSNCEFGDFSVIQCLRGWLPETIPLQYGHLSEVWELLKMSIPEFKLPEPLAESLPDSETGGEVAQQDGGAADAAKEKAMGDMSEAKVAKDTKDTTRGKDKDKGKEGKDKKEKDSKDKDKLTRVRSSMSVVNKGSKWESEDKGAIHEEAAVPEHPEVVVFAAYRGPPKYPVRISVLGEMADASERLRRTGFSHLYPHPVVVTQTRCCPLEPPPPPEHVPSWKLIRPKKRKTTPSEQHREPEVEKPIQCVEVTSPFLNYKVSPVPIPSATQRPRSSLERGSTRISSRPGTANVDMIEERDEDAPTPEPPQETNETQVLRVEELPRPLEENQLKPEGTAEGQKPVTPSGKGKKKSAGSANRLKSEAVEGSPEPDPKKPGTGPRTLTKRQSSAQMKLQQEGGSVKGGVAADQKSSKGSEGKAEANKDGKPLGLAALDPAAEPSLDASCNSRLTATDPGEEALDEQTAPEEADPEEEKPQKVWMDFEDFCKCFKTLYIFHKPHTYPSEEKFSDIKTAPPPTSTRDRRSAPNTAVGMNEEKAPTYLFVDNLKKTDIVVSFSALCRWVEPPPTPSKEESRSNVRGRGSDRGSKTEALTADSSSVLEGGEENRAPESLHPGLLVAEPYSWKSLVTGQPVLRLHSTATKTAVLSLPEGRHLLRFSMSAPLGHHLHLCSSTNFVFGDEEKVMAELTKESCRFVENATQVMVAMGKCISTFNDPDALATAMEAFAATHCPYGNHCEISKQYHYKVFHQSLYGALRRMLTEANLLNADMTFAWRAFTMDTTTPNILGLPHGSVSRPATGVTLSDRGSAGPGSKKAAKKHSSLSKDAGDQSESKLDHWRNREITAEEHVAAIKMQKEWRGYWVRKVKAARTQGTDENAKVFESLKKAWEVLEPAAERYGLEVFRAMFKTDPGLMPYYPFYKDEWNKIAYADYQGTYPDQPASSWFVVYREIFYVAEEMLCVPKLYVPVATCMLRVHNNDTGEEIPRVFQKVAPYVYKKNKRGYTFVAEARTTDTPLPAGRWRMRLIGSLTPLPSPSKSEVTSSFHSRELRDYYVPNDKHIILRYSIKVTEDHLTSLQMCTSKPDVYIKLAVLDNEQEVTSAVGKGHVVLPAFIFQKDHNGEDDSSKRSSSRGSNRGSKGSNANIKSKRTGSAHEGHLSRSSSRHSVCSTNEEEDKQPHKYTVQACVLRDSWPLSESQWAFVQMLKDMEKNELKLSHKERPHTPPRSEKMQSAASSQKGKDKSKVKGKDKDKGSRPPSQQFDYTKPNWTLRIVSDGTLAEELETRKDTERADEIRAMKKAWEEAEPGRAAKAIQSRLQYLNTHVVKVQSEVTEEADDNQQHPPADGSTSPTSHVDLEHHDSDVTLTSQPPPASTPKEVLQPIDLTPFIRRTDVSPRLRDEEEVARQLYAKQQQIQTYRQHRQDVLARRLQERQQRNQAKLLQLEQCERMQAALDAARENVSEPREAFRQKFLEAERRRLEEIAAQEAAMRAEMEKAPTPKGRRSAKGKKTPAGKKKK